MEKSMGTISTKHQHTLILRVALVILVFFDFGASVNASVPKWYRRLQRIEPLVTTRQSVEARLAWPQVVHQSSGNSFKIITYQLREGNLEVSYSAGRCSDTNLAGYDVASDTVIDYTLDLAESVKVSSLRLNLADFTQERESDTQNIYYRNLELGVEYLIAAGKVSSISVSPPAILDYLSCGTAFSKPEITATSRSRNIPYEILGVGCTKENKCLGTIYLEEKHFTEKDMTVVAEQLSSEFRDKLVINAELFDNKEIALAYIAGKREISQRQFDRRAHYARFNNQEFLLFNPDKKDPLKLIRINLKKKLPPPDK